MFEIGDKVNVGGASGQIVGWYFDEGNVWVVDLCGTLIDFCESELSPK